MRFASVVSMAPLLAVGCSAPTLSSTSEHHQGAGDAGTEVSAVAEDAAAHEGGTPCEAIQRTFVELGGDFPPARLEASCPSQGGSETWWGPYGIVGSNLGMAACGGGRTWALQCLEGASGAAIVEYSDEESLKSTFPLGQATVQFVGSVRLDPPVIGDILEGTYDATFVAEEASSKHLVGSFRVCLANIVGRQL
jgi:hypothetical protein